MGEEGNWNKDEAGGYAHGTPYSAGHVIDHRSMGSVVQAVTASAVRMAMHGASRDTVHHMAPHA